MNMLPGLLLFALMASAQGLYIKSQPANNAKGDTGDSPVEWQKFKKTLGLTNHKVELLKSQKDQQATVDMLNKFIEENPKYRESHVPEKQKPDDFLDVYRAIVKRLRASQQTLKTSLNFELADQPKKDLKRSRRKIAVRMVSDMPTDKIDDLLKAFNQKYGIEDDGDDSPATDAESEADYDDNAPLLPSASEPDYMYENLYEDEEATSTKSHTNSLQDLILQANRSQWEREAEETKLYNKKNEHYI